MHFAILGSYCWTTEAERGRAFTLYGSWQPPSGVDMVAAFQRCDGTGFVNIVRTDDPVGLLQSAASMQPYIRSEVIPLVSYDEGVPALRAIVDWAATVPGAASA